MTYPEYLKELIAGVAVGEPILMNRLSTAFEQRFGLPLDKAVQAVAVGMKRILDDQRIPELRRYRKGIYYKAMQTAFGETGIDRNRLISMKYLDGGVGYEGGRLALHKIGLTTQMPNERVVVTNRAKAGTRRDVNLEITTRMPATRITPDNIRYLQFLDILDCMDAAPVDADDPIRILLSQIESFGLEWNKLLYLSNRYHGKRTMRWLLRLAEQGVKGDAVDVA